MNEKKRTINKAALGKIFIAGGILIMGGVVYYTTAWKIKNDIVKPAMEQLTEAADQFLADWSGTSTKTEN